MLCNMLSIFKHTKHALSKHRYDCVPLGEVRFFSTLVLISLLLLLFLFTALGSSFWSPFPLALSFFRANSLAADRLRALGAAAGGELFSKKRMSSPSEKPRPRVGAWGAAGLWVFFGTSDAAFGDVRPTRPSVDDDPGLGPAGLCSTLFWMSPALCRRFCRSSLCLCFCCFSRSEAEMDWRGTPAASFETEDEKQRKHQATVPSWDQTWLETFLYLHVLMMFFSQADILPLHTENSWYAALEGESNQNCSVWERNRKW